MYVKVKSFNTAVYLKSVKTLFKKKQEKNVDISMVITNNILYT